MDERTARDDEPPATVDEQLSDARRPDEVPVMGVPGSLIPAVGVGPGFGPAADVAPDDKD
ncbi:MAG TPA: hypothetical protein VFM93_13715 [Candidatus Limnocylindria bacterium]|nr:hypothetical protein [Candidatus Limnocylindria bacterium]